MNRNSSASESAGPDDVRAGMSAAGTAVLAHDGDGSASPVICLYGKGVARGYAIGRAVVMGAAALEVAHYRIERCILRLYDADDHPVVDDDCRRFDALRGHYPAGYKDLYHA